MSSQNINRHFKLEAKIMVWFFIAPIILGIIVAIVYPKIAHGSRVDACLDSGGSFNYQICECDHEKNHPFEANSKCE